ncbi:hypothetical protein D1871_20050 [Nakamurella silvestris]|nr:hypothetical protein D1871_20050 [Nakamurella silvestris]
MSDQPPLLRYSPGSAPARSLEFVFVGREHLVQPALDSVADLLGDHGAAHHLFVGERGMGKSHLVSMIAGRLRRRYSAEDVRVVRLDEDPWSIRDYPGLLSAIVSRLGVAAPEGDVRDLENTLTDAAAEVPVVVIVENLGEVFGRIGADGRARLRAALENSRRITLLATAPERPVHITRHTEPFFGFFDVSDLLPLEVDEIVELVRRVARYSGHQDVSEFVTTDEGRAALAGAHGLLGGQPRVWTILGEISTVASLREPAALIRRVLDDLLPQYQDRVGALPPDQQAIVLLMVEAGGALTVRQIAAGIGVDQRSASSQLRHLATKGWVGTAPALTVDAGGDRRSAYYELREPLVRLCIQIKTGRGVPLDAALAYATGHPVAAEPGAMIESALEAFRADRDRAHLMVLPREWRTVAQQRLAEEAVAAG